jgi:hypothetical protein
MYYMYNIYIFNYIYLYKQDRTVEIALWVITTQPILEVVSSRRLAATRPEDRVV